MVANWSSSWYADMGCCSNYIPYRIWTPISHNLSLNLMVLVVYMHKRMQWRLSWLCAKALPFQIICCMHIQITILDGHTGINLGVWYPWLAAHVFYGMNLQSYTLGHIRWALYMYIWYSVQKPYTFTVISALKNLSKLKKCTISSIYLLFANIKRLLINAWVVSYGSDLTG